MAGRVGCAHGHRRGRRGLSQLQGRAPEPAASREGGQSRLKSGSTEEAQAEAAWREGSRERGWGVREELA
jgi:hypothetical protein